MTMTKNDYIVLVSCQFRWRVSFESQDVVAQAMARAVAALTRLGISLNSFVVIAAGGGVIRCLVSDDLAFNGSWQNDACADLAHALGDTLLDTVMFYVVADQPTHGSPQANPDPWPVTVKEVAEVAEIVVTINLPMVDLPNLPILKSWA